MTFTCFTSGAHAMNVAIQIHKGLQEALDATARLLAGMGWREEVGAVELAELLQSHGLPAVAWDVPRQDVPGLAFGAFDQGYTVLLRVRRSDAPREQRWALYWGDNGKQMLLAECAAPHEQRPMGGNLRDQVTGEMVVVEEDPGDSRPVVARRVGSPSPN